MGCFMWCSVRNLCTSFLLLNDPRKKVVLLSEALLYFAVISVLVCSRPQYVFFLFVDVIVRSNEGLFVPRGNHQIQNFKQFKMRGGRCTDYDSEDDDVVDTSSTSSSSIPSIIVHILSSITPSSKF